jgi:hypothetical protein
LRDFDAIAVARVKHHIAGNATCPLKVSPASGQSEKGFRMTVVAIDLDQAKLDPASVFLAPKDVLHTTGLSVDDKRSILVRWEADAEALLRATGEGMSESRSPAELLRAVHEAVESLESGN